MLSWVVNKYVQFVKYNSFIVFMSCMSIRTVKVHLRVVRPKYFVYETFTDEVIDNLLCKKYALILTVK